MALNPTQSNSTGLLPSPPISRPPQTPPTTPAIPNNAGPDQFQSSASTGQSSGPTATTPALRFGGNEPHKHESGPGFFRKTLGTTLGVLSGIGLAVGIPFGLLQMAVGIIIHPLLITGMITMGLPVLGLVAAYLLNHKK